MPRSHRADDAFYAAARRFVEDCLRHGDPLFGGGRPVWEEGPIRDLYARVVQSPDLSPGGFVEKLREQVGDAPGEVVQLAAELLYVVLLTQDTDPAKRLAAVDHILDVAMGVPRIPPELTVALDHGMASYGPALANRIYHYRFLLEFALRWVTFSRSQREQLLSDPQGFSETLRELPSKRASAQAEALKHLVFPDYFEPIVSVDVKRGIVRAFEAVSGDRSLPLDRRVAEVRRALTAQYGEGFSFYGPEVQRLWAAPVDVAPSLQRPTGLLIELVVKWSDRYGSNTVDDHREVADRAGSVWWGLIGKAGKPKLSEKAIDMIRAQLRAEEPTHIYIAGPTCWRTTLKNIAIWRDDVDQDLIPSYYPRGLEHRLWVELEDFEPIDRSWLKEHLELVRDAPGTPLAEKALGNPQNPLIVRLAQSAPSARSSPPPDPVARLDLETLALAVDREGVKLPDDVLPQLLAALESGKHVILTGPPGTAKTTLAHLVARHAMQAGHCRGFVPTTATSDWTTYETIGGLRPMRDQTLQFQPGHFLAAIEQSRWLVIDELNRSNFDRAFGQLFTVLSGQTVVLPYERVPGAGPIALIPADAPHPGDAYDVVEVPATWRIVATMNVFDKTLLFEMSYALMRRFAFVEVPSPSADVFEELIAGWTDGEPAAAEIASRLLAVRSVKDIGPAAFRDIARYARERLALDAPQRGRLLFDAFYSFLLPQFEGIDEELGGRLFDSISGALQRPERARLLITLNTVLGLELAAKASGRPAEEPDAPIEDDAA